MSERRAERGTVTDVAQAYSSVWSSQGTTYVRTRRTSLVIDPPDGRIPHSPAGLAAIEAEIAYRRALSAADLRTVVDMAAGPEDRPNDRCHGFVLPCTSFHCAFSRIVQDPESVASYYEGGQVGGAYRVISLERSQPPPAHVRQWYGSSIGRWESDTLVVETANFTSWKSGPLTSSPLGFRGNGEQFRLTERFARVAPDMILYRATVENPALYARPWTIEVPWVQLEQDAVTGSK